MNLVQIETELIRLNAERAEAAKAHKEYMDKMGFKIEELNRQKDMSMEGIDLDKIAAAERLLYVRGLNYGEYNERCVNEAIKDIAQDTPKMEKQYFGVKNYSGWRHQESDHPYGYGPSHGSIVFAVGLNRPRQKLTDEEKESCLYYLNLLLDKQKRGAIAKVKSA